jgi:glucose-1-phosphate cytidylyltransferase
VKTVILAGGLGSRLAEQTDVVPKPMVRIGDHPILWHIMRGYSAFGFTEFVVTVGYKGDVIKNYFLDYFQLSNDFTVSTADGRVDVHHRTRDDWTVHVVDTGVETQTGGRLRLLRPWLEDGRFMLAYGDGVANVDIKALLAFHERHGRLATVTAVRPPARFGGLIFDGDVVSEFTEKPQIGEGWINGGFFVLEPGVLDYIESEETIWEREPLERLASEGQLVAYRHDGFWQPMDTLRDVRLLESLWHSDNVPWKVWP